MNHHLLKKSLTFQKILNLILMTQKLIIKEVIVILKEKKLRKDKRKMLKKIKKRKLNQRQKQKEKVRVEVIYALGTLQNNSLNLKKILNCLKRKQLNILKLCLM